MKKAKIILIVSFLLFLAKPCLAQVLSPEDLDKYIWRKEIVINISSEADDLREKLSQEIQKMISAGHLAPYRIAPAEGAIFYLWYHAGEPIYTLSEALKYLPKDDLQTKQNLRNYLQQEITNYPPYTPTAVYDRAPWLPLDKGARREYYPLETIPKLVSYLNQGHPVIQTFYHIWDYIDATEDIQMVTDNWSKIKSLFDKLKNRAGEDKSWMDRGGCVAKYGDIAGCIGIARLAYLASQQDVVDEAISRIFEGFNNGLNFALFEQNAARENKYFRETNDGETIRTYVFLNLFPETAKFLKEHNLQAVQKHLDNLSWNIPTWYATYGRGFVGGEVSLTTPLISYPMFQAYAQVLDKDSEFLRKRLDVPLAKVGDLYYIQNLISTIKSYGQTCWEDIRIGEMDCEPLQFVPPDLNQDTKVNSQDIAILLSSWGRTDKPTKDINQDQKIDTKDLLQILSAWTEPLVQNIIYSPLSFLNKVLNKVW